MKKRFVFLVLLLCVTSSNMYSQSFLGKTKEQARRELAKETDFTSRELSNSEGIFTEFLWTYYGGAIGRAIFNTAGICVVEGIATIAFSDMRPIMQLYYDRPSRYFFYEYNPYEEPHIQSQNDNINTMYVIKVFDNIRFGQFHLLFYNNDNLADVTNIVGFLFSEEMKEIERISNERIRQQQECTNGPSFPGGNVELNRYIRANFHYPLVDIELGKQGTVVVQFVVNEDGRLSDFKVINSVSQGCDAEALRLVRQMPNWFPKCQDGQAIKAEHQLPLHFRLQTQN